MAKKRTWVPSEEIPKPTEPPVSNPAPSESEANYLLDELSAQGLALRQVKVARLQRKGMSPPAIAESLSKTDRFFTLEVVLNLMGEGEGPYEDLRVLKRKYEAVLEVVTQNELLDPEAEILEFRTFCLTTAKRFILARTSDCPSCGRTVPDKESAEMALKWAKGAGVGLGEVERKVVEHRFDPDFAEVLRRLARSETKAGESLERLMQSEASGGDAGDPAN